MVKVITGFVLGVIMTLAVVYWLDESPPEMKTVSNDQSLPSDQTAEVQQANQARGLDEAAAGDVKVSDLSKSAERDSNDEQLDLQAQSTIAPQQDSKTTSAIQRPSAEATNDQYPPEIAEMIENRVDKELQARYENDEREESWAIYMEGQLAAYFAQKPELAQFNISLIDCRTSICEIHAIGYGTDALTLWNIGTADIVTQTWHDFRSMSMNRNNPAPDVLAIVLILSRKPPD